MWMVLYPFRTPAPGLPQTLGGSSGACGRGRARDAPLPPHTCRAVPALARPDASAAGVDRTMSPAGILESTPRETRTSTRCGLIFGLWPSKASRHVSCERFTCGRLSRSLRPVTLWEPPGRAGGSRKGTMGILLRPSDLLGFHIHVGVYWAKGTIDLHSNRADEPRWHQPGDHLSKRKGDTQ